MPNISPAQADYLLRYLNWLRTYVETVPHHIHIDERGGGGGGKTKNRCKCKTKSGTRCKKLVTKGSSSKCHIHQ